MQTQFTNALHSVGAKQIAFDTGWVRCPCTFSTHSVAKHVFAKFNFIVFSSVQFMNNQPKLNIVKWIANEKWKTLQYTKMGGHYFFLIKLGNIFQRYKKFYVTYIMLNKYTNKSTIRTKNFIEIFLSGFFAFTLGYRNA